MDFWLCILNRENFEIVKQMQIWGVKKRNRKTLALANLGDRCIFYLSGEGSGKSRKDPALGGIFEVISEPYESSTDIFPFKRNTQEIYPFRINLKTIKIFNPELPFKPLVQKLSFITNKKNFGAHLFGKSMCKISENDAKFMYSYI